VNRVPQPPQNRESGALSVPQLGQRICVTSVTYLDRRRLTTPRQPIHPPCGTVSSHGHEPDPRPSSDGRPAARGE
jgi:hypothetical protein